MKKILFIFSFFVALSARATTFYIDAALGDDGAAGSIGAPWATFYHATQTATTFGDIIFVKAGSYTENHQCTLAPGVNIDGDGKAVAVIHATNTTNFGYLLLLFSANGTNGFQYIRNVGFQSVRSTSGTDIAIRINGRKNIDIYNCDFQNFRYSGITINGRDENTGGGGTIGDPFILPVGNEYATGNKIHDNTFNNCSTFKHILHDGSTFGFFGSGQIAVGSQDGFECYNNTMIQDNGINGDNGWLIKIGNSGFIKNCSFHDNVWTKNKFIGDYQGDNDFSFVFEMWNGRGNNKIYNNTITGGGLDMAYSRRDVGTYSWEVYNNNFSLPTLNNKQACAMFFEAGCSGANIHHNRISKYYNGIIVSVEYFDDNADHNNKIDSIIIRKNLFDSIGAADPTTGDESITYNGGNANAIYLGGQAVSNTDSFTHIYIDSNTFVGAPNHKPYALINANNNDNHAVKHDWIFSYNIFVNANDYYLTTGNDVGTAITGFQFINNTTYNNGNSNAVDFGSPTPTSPTISGTLTSDPQLTAAPVYAVPQANASYGRGYLGGEIAVDVIRKIKKRLK